MEHESHTGLGNIVLTNRCDLTCWYCLPYNEELPVKMDGKVRIMKIGELVEKGMEENSKKIEEMEGFYSVPKSEIEVLAFEDGKAVWAKVNKLLKRKYKGQFVKIKTQTGKEIITTADHRFAVISDKFQKKTAQEIEKERLLTIANMPESSTLEYIDLFEAFKNLPEGVASSVYVHNIEDVFGAIKENGNIKDFFSGEKNFYSWKHRGIMPLNVYNSLLQQTGVKPNGISFGVDGKQYEMGRKLEITKELAKLVGYFLADGHYAKQNIWYTCKDEFVRNDIVSCLEKLGLNYSIINVKGKATQINVGNKLFALVFRYAFGINPGAANKRVPSFVFSSPEDVRISCLSGLFNGDGFVTKGERHASLGYASVSEGLVGDVAYLLNTVGVFSRKYNISMESNELANYSSIGKLYISGQFMENLASMIELKTGHKERLKGISKRRGVRLDFLGDFALDGLAKVDIFEDKEQFVYDLVVESKSHTFIAGSGILVSNCFFYAKEGEPIYEPTLDQIKFMLKRMANEKPIGANAVQLTGGEPTLREDLTDIIRAAKEIGYDHVQLNTNGVNLSRSLELCQKVKDAGGHVLYMSFDGVTPQTNPKNYWEAQKALENCKQAGIGVVLVPTVIGGINDHELGDIIRFGMGNLDVVRSVNFQPVSLVGRMPDSLRRKQRITIPGAIKRIEEQTDGQIGREHWFPVPCAKQVTDFVEALKQEPKYRLSIHFACGMATYAFKDGDRMVALPAFFDIEGFFDYLSELTREINASRHKTLRKPYVIGKLLLNMRKYIDNSKKPKDLKFMRMLAGAMTGTNYHGLADFHHNSLFVGMMHFQDPNNWDIDRIHKCDIHYATPDGRILPFCTFNVIPELYRDRIQRKFSIPAAEWEKKTGKKLTDDKHHRRLTPEEMRKIVDNYNRYRKYTSKPQLEPDWGQEAAEEEQKELAARHSEALIPVENVISTLTGAAKFGAAKSVVKKKATTTHPAAGVGLVETSCCNS